ncbi:MAG: hypothetical protein JW967_11590 [Dehalococcoidales bacterium]|nr:hypothetical protein [Dehalococcoidales bacterium]
MVSNKGNKASKNSRRKARRYGKKTDNMQSHTSPELNQFISSLLKPPVEEDHSLDELEYKRRPWFIFPGSFEMGKRR